MDQGKLYGLLGWDCFWLTVGLLALAATVFGCATAPEIAVPMEVKVPIAVTPDVPQELRAAIVTDALPEFVEPGAKEASVALTAANVQRLQSLLWALRSRVSQWEAFGRVERRHP